MKVSGDERDLTLSIRRQRQMCIRYRLISWAVFEDLYWGFCCAACFFLNFAKAILLVWDRVIAARVCISPPGNTVVLPFFFSGLIGACPAFVACSTQVRPVFKMDLGFANTIGWLGIGSNSATVFIMIVSSNCTLLGGRVILPVFVLMGTVSWMGGMNVLTWRQLVYLTCPLQISFQNLD